MSLHRRKAKRDAVEPAIVEALKQCGWSVERVSAPGFPDLVLWHRCFGYVLAECKAGKGKLTPEQVDWRKRWKGPEPVILRSVEDVLRLMQTRDRP